MVIAEPFEPHIGWLPVMVRWKQLMLKFFLEFFPHYFFLFADLLCCAAVFPIFYGMFKGDIDEKLSLISVIIGLISGLLLFPNQTFDKIDRHQFYLFRL